jgi:uncharacterized protein (TIGR02466 family)
MPIEYWWPTPIYYSHFDEDSSLLDEMSAEVDTAILTTPTHNPWGEAKIQTSFLYDATNLFLDRTPKLKKYINKHIKNYTEIDFFISESWINIGGSGARQEKHMHLRSEISGCYYHKTNTLDGAIVFECNDKMLQKFSGSNITSIEYQPELGKIILFPSYLTHSVKTNQTEDDRISIAFNIRTTEIEAHWKCR